MIFNEKKPTITSINNIHFPFLVNLKLYRQASIMKVYEEGSNTLRQLLSSAPISLGKYKRILVDIKVQTLDKDTVSCIPGWHLDGKLTTVNDDRNTYHILCFGGAPTEFIGCPFNLNNDLWTSQSILKKYIPNNIEVYKLPEYVWNSYTELDWHRGVSSETPCTRTFIRLTETNYLRSKYK